MFLRVVLLRLLELRHGVDGDAARDEADDREHDQDLDERDAARPRAHAHALSTFRSCRLIDFILSHSSYTQ